MDRNTLLSFLEQEKRKQYKDILNSVCAYANLAAGWDPKKEDDWEDFKDTIKEILYIEEE